MCVVYKRPSVLVRLRDCRMELDDDCTASILESLHQRVMKLEDVWKVEYEIGDARQPLEMLLTGTSFLIRIPCFLPSAAVSG